MPSGRLQPNSRPCRSYCRWWISCAHPGVGGMVVLVGARCQAKVDDRTENLDAQHCRAAFAADRLRSFLDLESSSIYTCQTELTSQSSTAPARLWGATVES